MKLNVILLSIMLLSFASKASDAGKAPEFLREICGVNLTEQFQSIKIISEVKSVTRVKEQTVNSRILKIESQTPNFTGYLEILSFDPPLNKEIDKDRFKQELMEQENWSTRNNVKTVDKLLTSPSLEPPLMLYRKGLTKVETFLAHNVQVTYILTTTCHAHFDVIIANLQGARDEIVEKFFRDLRTLFKNNISKYDLMRRSSPSSPVRKWVAIIVVIVLALFVLISFFILKLLKKDRRKNQS